MAVSKKTVKAPAVDENAVTKQLVEIDASLSQEVETTHGVSPVLMRREDLPTTLENGWVTVGNLQLKVGSGIDSIQKGGAIVIRKHPYVQLWPIHVVFTRTGATQADTIPFSYHEDADAFVKTLREL